MWIWFLIAPDPRSIRRRTGLAEAQGYAAGPRVVALVAGMTCGVRGEATAASSRKLCRSFCLRVFVAGLGEALLTRRIPPSSS